jgi:hypothetical protein
MAHHVNVGVSRCSSTSKRRAIAGSDPRKATHARLSRRQAASPGPGEGSDACHENLRQLFGLLGSYMVATASDWRPPSPARLCSIDILPKTSIANASLIHECQPSGASVSSQEQNRAVMVHETPKAAGEIFDQITTSNDRPRSSLESLIRSDYERCHPGDTWEDLKRRARFSKEDKGLLRDWMTLAICRRSQAVPSSVRQA